MSNIAKWRKKKWFITDKQIKDFKDLAFTFEQNAQNNRSTEGQSLTNEKGLKLFEMTFSTTLLISTGVNVRKEIDSWRAEVTKTGVFYLNGKPIIASKLRLNKVSVSEVIVDNKGRMAQAIISFHFVEYDSEKKTVDTSSSAQKVKASAADKKELKKTDKNIKSVATTGIKKGTYIIPTTTTDLDGNAITETYPMQVVQVNNGMITFLDSHGQRRTVTSNQVTMAT